MVGANAIPLVSMLTHLTDHLIEFFHFPEVEDDIIWKNDRNEFLKSIEKEM